jgi:hypothetical protein
MVRFGDWGPKEQRIQDIQGRLLDLWTHLRSARHKILAHNDLEVLMTDTPLGGLPQGTDDQYFEALQELANEVSEKWIGNPHPFNDLAQADFAEFLAVLERA